MYLLLEEGACTVDTIATVLTGWSATDEDAMGAPDDRQQILISLEHVHLPLLAEADLITRDREDGTVDIESLDAAICDLVRHSVDAESRSTA